MPNPPPIKTKAQLDEAEDVPRRTLNKVREHHGDTAPTEATAHVDLFGVRPKLAGAVLAGYVVGAPIHHR